jgi:hypothetical protein
VSAREVAAVAIGLELADDELGHGAPSVFAIVQVRIQLGGNDALQNGSLRSARLMEGCVV